MFVVDQVTRILGYADNVIAEERESLAAVYQWIEEYAAQEKLYLAGPSSINRMESDGFQITYYEFYVNYALTHATKLANYLDERLAATNAECTEKYSMKVCSMRTIIPRHTFGINVSTRELVRIHENRKYEIIEPFTVGKLSFIPPELQLIDIYRDLYNPAKEGNWDDLLGVESVLSKLTLENSKQIAKLKVKPVDGGAIDQSTLDQFVEQSGAKRVPIKSRVVVSCNSIEDDLVTLERILGYKPNIFYVECDILNDFRLVRNSIKDKDRKDLFFIYTIQYDLLPYVLSETHALVTLRIILVEIWIIRIITYRGSLKKEVAETIVTRLLDEYKQHREKWDGKCVDNPSQYMGVYLPEKFYIKELQKESQFFAEYVPMIYKKANGVYRVIENRPH